MLFELLYKYNVKFQATLFDSSTGEVQQPGDFQSLFLMNALPSSLSYLASPCASFACEAA